MFSITDLSLINFLWKFVKPCRSYCPFWHFLAIFSTDTIGLIRTKPSHMLLIILGCHFDSADFTGVMRLLHTNFYFVGSGDIWLRVDCIFIDFFCSWMLRSSENLDGIYFHRNLSRRTTFLASETFVKCECGHIWVLWACSLRLYNYLISNIKFLYRLSHQE